ncbi:hypothetical protein ACFSN5_01705 [Streptococcus tangpeifui]|uniref:hypothetical protein n=1 Tax=Streptococcus tangpeifui TaxID=2709400 RepID=UPI0013EAA8F4|nr:hypothetical protein [Streptococcus sp. ZJ373]
MKISDLHFFELNVLALTENYWLANTLKYSKFPSMTIKFMKSSFIIPNTYDIHQIPIDTNNKKICYQDDENNN